MKRTIHREFSTSELLEETLAGIHGVEALRAMALDPLPHGVRELLAEQAPWWDGSTPRLIRTKYKPSRKLSAYYELSPGDPARHAAVAWTNESIEVLVSPDDPSMPQLARLHDRRLPHRPARLHRSDRDDPLPAPATPRPPGVLT